MLLKVAVNEVRYQQAVIISDINFEVSSGEIIAILGRNGSGKSSLIKSIVGIDTNWDGNIILDGVVIETPEPDKLKAQGLAYLPQTNPFAIQCHWRDHSSCPYCRNVSDSEK